MQGSGLFQSLFHYWPHKPSLDGSLVKMFFFLLLLFLPCCSFCQPSHAFPSCHSCPRYTFSSPCRRNTKAIGLNLKKKKNCLVDTFPSSWVGYRTKFCIKSLARMCFGRQCKFEMYQAYNVPNSLTYHMKKKKAPAGRENRIYKYQESSCLMRPANKTCISK